MNPFLLLLIGLILIFLEFFLPGAILGTLGTLAVISSIAIYASLSTSILATLLFILGAIAAVTVLFRFALWRIQNNQEGLYARDDQEGYIASTFDKEAIGKIAEVYTDLKPGGYILIEGKKHQAQSMDGYVPKGRKVKVIDGTAESLIVETFIEEQ
jgi:membrane-bound ClpP family serine protease